MSHVRVHGSVSAPAAGVLAALLITAACGGAEEPAADNDGLGDGGPGQPATCTPWSHDGFEPACDFEPGPGSGRTAPPETALPKPTGTCPGFVAGDGCIESSGALVCTFQPAGEPPREVHLWLPPAGSPSGGPLVLYYFGLLGFPANAVTPFAGFPADALALLHAEGGMLVAPTARADRLPVKLSRLPWIDALGFEDDDGDFLLVDEVVGCAAEKVGVDVRRIHASGLSAGGWMTSRVAVNRSSYMASIVTFSGGIEDLSGLQDPENKFPVVMFNGGPNDFVGAHFENEAQSGVNLWRSLGHFALNCEHGAGHLVPVQAGLAGMRFLLDHPYGTLRSPYCDAPPPDLEYCALTSRAVNGVVPASGRPESEVTACRDQIAGMGLQGSLLTDEALTCACARCGPQLEACLTDAGCVENMRCSAEKGCLGISCYQDHLCAPAIDAAGGAMGPSAQLAVAFTDCVGAAACTSCQLPTD